MSDVEYEQRARAVKAYKLEQILRLMLNEPGVTVDVLRTASAAVRERTAELAKCRVPSDLTWQMACDLIEGGAPTMRVRYVIEKSSDDDKRIGMPVALGEVDSNGEYTPGGSASLYASIDAAKAAAEAEQPECTSWKPAPKEWQPDTILVSNYWIDEGWTTVTDDDLNLFSYDDDGSDDRSLQAAFEAFHAQHPEVYAELVRRARRLLARGYRHLGIKMLWEVLRYRTMLGAAPDEEPYRLNNNYTARYARLMMDAEPDLAGVFETRNLRTD